MAIELYLLFMLLIVAVLYVVTLYHFAHGRSLDAVQRGADIVISALRDNGSIRDSEKQPESDDEPWIVDEVGHDEPEENQLPDVLVARSERMAKQMGQAELNKIMEEMDGKV